MHREELRPALGLHALVYRCQRQAEGASDAAIDSEIAAWPLPGPFFLGARDSARSEFAPEREFRRDDRRRRSRRPEIDDLEPRPRLPEVSSPKRASQMNALQVLAMTNRSSMMKKPRLPPS